MNRFPTSLFCIAVSVALSLVLASFTSLPVFAGADPKFRSAFGVGANTLVINEIDYDQTGTDTAEFIELKNVSGGPLNLDNFTVELINGSMGGAVPYAPAIDLPNVILAADDYYVICANAATVVNCDLDVTPDEGFLQNGDPDAIGVRLSGTLVDAVSYGGDSGAPYTETTGTVTDSIAASVGLSRSPDGTDTNNNSADISRRCISPGAPNVTASTSCATTAAAVSISGRVTNAAGRGIGKVHLTLTSGDGTVTNVLTGPFGYYAFEGVTAGQTYLISVSAKGRQFNDPVRVVNVGDAIAEVDFVAN